ncbi:MAG: PaaX family transcriptional regulator [Paracoccus denitrificans]|nr:MAG: PaaX family transcriptional regulator [Paracoccus denitrificans]PZO84286.1 MAG: PaaX family transcriptional regulator [Paracoccus denitrificans]
MTSSAVIRALCDDAQLTAGSFIVTVYGDVVVPRGEVLWMGSLIEVCAQVGISENLVRTAVSRLVSAGRLEGERAGRRSFYRLAPAARDEFAGAERLLYAPPVSDAAANGAGAPQGWRLVQGAGMADDALRRAGFGRLGGDVWIAPDRGQQIKGASVTMTAAPVGDSRALAACWDLEPIAAGYARLVGRFAPLAAQPMTEGADALMARLLLVDAYRAVLLRDPRLPPDALPPDWPGHTAAALFRKLYLGLSPQADAEVAQWLLGERHNLPAETPRTQARLDALTGAPPDGGSQPVLRTRADGNITQS